VWEAPEYSHDAPEPFGLGRGVEAKSDLMRKFDLDATGTRLAGFGGRVLEVDRDKERRVLEWGTRPSGESSLPLSVRGSGDAFT
jgi:hypothetical protein